MRCVNMLFRSKALFFAAVIAIAIALPASARADYALLSNGFRLRFFRAEENGAAVRLFLEGGGYVDLAPSDIQGYEKEEPLPSPSSSPAANLNAQSSLPSLLADAGNRHGLDPALLKSMIATESNFNPRAVSPKGARGLMQLMPGTADLLGVKDLFSAVENVQGGALYIRSLLERYQGDLAKALAAYNAGPAKVDRYGGIPPYAETENYVRRVITLFNREKSGK
jgi:soluble lytic murein transglycosylase-like protein